MKIKVEFDVEIKQVDTERGKRYACYIPEIDTYFDAKDYEGIKNKTNAIVKSFCMFWEEYNRK